METLGAEIAQILSTSLSIDESPDDVCHLKLLAVTISWPIAGHECAVRVKMSSLGGHCFNDFSKERAYWKLIVLLGGTQAVAVSLTDAGTAGADCGSVSEGAAVVVDLPKPPERREIKSHEQKWETEDFNATN